MDGVITGEIFMVPSQLAETKAFIDAYVAKYNVNPGKVIWLFSGAVNLIADAMDKAAADSITKSFPKPSARTAGRRRGGLSSMPRAARGSYFFISKSRRAN